MDTLVRQRIKVLAAGAVVLGSILLGVTASRGSGSEVVREDWYFRESLRAIRDWETVLARCEKEKQPESIVPVCPVPVNGDVVDWCNPIPLRLLPPDDRNRGIRLRLDRGQVAVERLLGGQLRQRETFAQGSPLTAYKHPGGGGKDQWYHAYHRRFDRLTTFVAKPAPLAIRLNGPFDFGRGKHDVVVTTRNTLDRPLKAELVAQWHSPASVRDCGRQAVTLAAGGEQVVRFPLDLDREGGGLFAMRIAIEGNSYWLPLLTYVEDVRSVLASVDQLLTDTPDAGAAAEVAWLRKQSDQWGHSGTAPSSDGAWRSLFERASRLRDRLLLARLKFDALLFVKRKPYDSEQPFMDAHHLLNRPGGGIYRLSPVRPDGRLTALVDSLGEGVYRDVCLHWDARRLLFAFGNGSDRWNSPTSYHVYEVHADGSGIRQLTSGPKNDCEPFYLPNGQIGFTSDRSEHYVMCGGDRHSPNLFVMEGDGSNVRELSFNVFNDYNPTVMPDGRILYSRWEYNERSVTSLHNPFTMNPDGTMVQPYYGNATIRPNVVMFPRPVPNSSKVMALFTAHHGQTHGAVGLIDVRRGIDGAGPLTLLTPHVPITGEKAEDSAYGWFSDPMPLSESTWLCSYTPTLLPWLERSWALYVADRHGNLALVYRDPAISCAEPVPLIARATPHVLPKAGAETSSTTSEATLLLADVYRGLTGVPRGTARYLRILEDLPRKSVPNGGVICTSGTLIFTVKRVFGTVPIESDGSAHFVVPANRNVYFEALDKDFLEIQRMRSVVCLKPGEKRGCVGCHEGRNQAPPAVLFRAAHRPPSRPEPPPWGTRTVSFLRDVQPLLNARCVACHTHQREKNKVILTDDLTNQFTIGYQELLPYLTVAISNRWDHDDDVLPRPPYTYGSKVSPLVKLLAQDHYGVSLSAEDWQRLATWIDCNGVYYDRYENDHYPNRQIFTGPAVESAQRIVARRCGSCHAGDDGRGDTWWLSLNRRDVRKSRALAAPLAASAGGWQRCESVVFADTNDADYQALLAVFSGIRGQLAKHPREDLLSIAGTEAERQAVAIPSPPLPTPAKSIVAEGGWVYLSDLTWKSGRAGWSGNGDGLPRRDRDIEGHPLRIGNKRYPKGLGTHAPSEIVYQLDGGFERFQALVGPSEDSGTVVFRVFGDDRVLFDSGVLRSRQSAAVDVPLAGVRQLRLVVTDAGDGYFSDSANWAAARLRRSRDAAK